MLDILYQIIIFPLYALFEGLFNFVFIGFSGNILLTIFFISFVVNLFCLPLYINADRLQNEEKEIQRKLAPKINIIKKNFKGDEKHMLLQTYYRQNNYHPIMSLKLSFSLLLQIPFFLAAYLFFNNLSILERLSLFNICKLSQPDGLLTIGFLSINILPIIMTIINLFAGYIYSKDSDKKEKFQLWAISLIFLVLLYNSPSGLVIYWTFNNLFSLIKNVGLKCSNPKLFFNIFIGIICILFFLVLKGFYLSLFNISIIFGLLLVINKIDFPQIIENKQIKFIYFLSCFALFILFGILIPTNLIATSPEEYAQVLNQSSPLILIVRPFLNFIGVFIFWTFILYIFSSDKKKKVIAFLLSLFLFFSLFNMFYIKMPNYSLSTTLEYIANGVYFVFNSKNEVWIYRILSIFLTLGIFILFFKNKIGILKKCLIMFICTFLLVSIINIFQIQTKHKKYSKILNFKNNIFETQFNFSKEKNNVLIIFLDRAVSSYLPFIFEEKPELKEIYEGFIYYPNTVSFYGHTIFAYPAMIGGYEYTPTEMARRNKELLVNKHNEALFVLPTIFKNNGWKVKVVNSPFGDYQNYTDPSLFCNRDIDYSSLKGRYNLQYVVSLKYSNEKEKFYIKRNLFYFGFLITSPNFIKNFIYSNGKYLDFNRENNLKYFSNSLVDNYSELYYLPKITDFSAQQSSFIIINNDLPHQEHYLSYPDYKLQDEYDKKCKYDINEFSQKLFHVNAASIILVSDYLKFLKENNVYDNTRIIIVSDHGYELETPANIDKSIDLFYNPLLLVKDFNAKEPFKTSYEFMTNADVPYLATEGIIKNARNPFTGKKISNSQKRNGVYIMSGHVWLLSDFENLYTPFERLQNVHFVKDNIFDKHNWKLDIPYSDIKDKI